jgi:hypothetical protein
MLRVRIKMRLGGWESCSEDTDAGVWGGVSRSFGPESTTRDPAWLTWVCVQGDLKPVIYGQARRAFKDPFVGYKVV